MKTRSEGEKIGVVFSIIGGLLIFFPTFFINPSSRGNPFLETVFIWDSIESAITGFYYLLGLLLGILIFVGIGFVYKRKNFIGGLLILISSLLSITSMGGFFIGMFLGATGGILILKAANIKK